MTQAAEQCREYLEVKYPGVRIGRLNCRDTAGGSVSQHSAYDGYDSNALDIMGGSTDGIPWSRSQNIILIQTIVDDLNENFDKWSIRKILWKVALHFGHAHIDYYPMCEMHKWCGGPEAPSWRYSDNSTVVTRDPIPENGEYHGEEEMTFATFVEGWVEGLAEDKVKARQEFQRLYDAGILEGNDTTVDYWVGLLDDPTNKEWPGFYARTELSVWGM